MRHDVTIVRARPRPIDIVGILGIILTAVVLLLHLPATVAANQRAETGDKTATRPAAPASESDDAAPASSQAEKTATRERKPSPVGIGVGVAVERRLASDPRASDTWGVSFLPRFITRGLGPAFNLPWMEVGAVRELGKNSAELAVLRMRPTLGGLSWEQPLAHGFTAEVRFLAGYSFNAIRDPKQSRRDDQVVVPDRVTDIDNSLAWEPRVALWKDLNPRIGVMIAGRYLHNRPKLTFADGTKRAWNADRVTIEIGFAFTLVPGPPERRLGIPCRGRPQSPIHDVTKRGAALSSL